MTPAPAAAPWTVPGARLLVTGGAGFIGSCFVREVLARRDGTRIAVLDKLTYAGNEANLRPALDDPEQAGRLTFVRGDIADPLVVEPLVADADAVVNFAAESHVDRSILDPEAFLRTGVIGVHVLLDACLAVARSGRPIRYLQVSTDEVYGSVEVGRSVETSALAPRSPYAAAKAAGELLVRSYVVTHGLDAVVTRGSNTYGPYHHPEKLIPLFITNALDDLPLPLYGDGLQVRDWLHVSDHAAGVEHVLRHGAAGETYNLPGGNELPNREVVRRILDHLGKPWSLVRQVADRPGHDRRYAMDGSKIAALGWRPLVPVRRRGSPRPSTGSSRTRPGGGRSRRATGTPTTSASTARASPGRAPPAAIRPGGSEVRVVVTGAGGRLGRALIAAFADAPFTGLAGPIGWSRPDYDLDDPSAAARLVARDRPEVVVHAAAWTDVDGCAREPELALRRNRDAPGSLAVACAASGADLVLISTNEVFDGRRTDGRGYGPDDPTDSAEPVRGEQARRRAGRARGVRRGSGIGPGDRPDGLAVRTAGQRLPGQDPGGRGAGECGR